jgi:uncharacterized membrane protein YvlD (DUF360 family)
MTGVTVAGFTTALIVALVLGVAQYFYQTYFSYTHIASNLYYSWAFFYL